MILNLTQLNRKIISHSQKLKYESIWFGIVTNPIITESYQRYQNYIIQSKTTSKKKELSQIEANNTSHQLFKARETKRKIKETTNEKVNNFGLSIIPKEKELLKLILNESSIVSKYKEMSNYLN